MRVFEEARLPDFEDYMVEHLKEFSPFFSESLGQAAMRSVINAGMERAKKHGFTYRGPVRFYIETAILLGIDFDTDPQYPWAAKLLDDATLTDQTQRADRVHGQLMDFLDAVDGPDHAYTNRALRVLRESPMATAPASSPDFADAMLCRMQEVHPEKAQYVGEPALRGLIAKALEESGKFNISTGAGVSLILALMFVIGHGCANDPKFPWIAGTLNNPAVVDPNQRADRLYSKAITYLDHVLTHLDRN
jgi:hypothetical protein